MAFLKMDMLRFKTSTNLSPAYELRMAATCSITLERLCLWVVFFFLFLNLRFTVDVLCISCKYKIGQAQNMYSIFYMSFFFLFCFVLPSMFETEIK